MDSICEQNHQTNVLLVTISIQGHLNPILRLGNTLVSKGLNITLAANDYVPKNRPSVPNTIGGVQLQLFSDGLPIEYNRQGNMEHFMDMLGEFGPVNLLALIQSHPRKFSCIIYTPLVPWAADVAAEIGVPSAMLWIQACTVYQIYDRFYNQLDEFPSQSNQNLCVKLPGLPVFVPEELPSFVLPSNKFRMFDNILNEMFHNMHKVQWVLGNSFMEIEKDVIASVNEAGRKFLPVGPIVPPILLGMEGDVDLDNYQSGEESICIEWLNKQEPSSVVYISFGTLLFLSQKQIESIAIGLKHNKRPFLWVIRPTENQNTSELDILEEIKDQGLIVSWSPQTSVLSHPSVGCFLSHCGWNSLLESIAAGVPLIACPEWTDQPTNAKLVTDVWGVGVKLKKSSEGSISGDEVERCVEEIMSGPRSTEFKKNAAELKLAACRALTDGGSSENNIQMFINEIIASSSSNSIQD
ncbi:UDP-glucuronosyl/UDP-glucosyltransferase [Artemisia annua]|uniref:Glycosyltransferase n=1 Tax=Artemisia annua TaxID=35608 RepID=A0A2U1KZB8_ARTAN|nr:UDP-glucuronosyl/UDP-glucosyltransferase [Artemisia annua]